MKFIHNSAENGGTVYISDNGSASCFSSIEYSIQSVAINIILLFLKNAVNVTANKPITFFGNTAALYHGCNVFFFGGGLFDRCTPSPFATVYVNNSSPVQYSGICFCDRTGHPDCSYEMPTIGIQKGGKFTVSVVAVD